jgi:heme-degrading monooxygenase HmoA
MIARQWIGETLASTADEYLNYLEETGVNHCKRTKGNKGVWLLRRIHEGKARFVFISLWDSFDSVKAFAGADYEKAVYYPEDTKFLLFLDPHVTHFEVMVSPDSSS